MKENNESPPPHYRYPSPLGNTWPALKNNIDALRKITAQILEVVGSERKVCELYVLR